MCGLLKRGNSLEPWGYIGTSRGSKGLCLGRTLGQLSFISGIRNEPSQGPSII